MLGGGLGIAYAVDRNDAGYFEIGPSGLQTSTSAIVAQGPIEEPGRFHKDTTRTVRAQTYLN